MLSRRSLLLALAPLGLALRPARADAALTVFAAASLKNALDEVAAAWKVKTKLEISISYAASSALARQIEAGAPADVFISADMDWMQYLAAKGLVDGARPLLGNDLVLVAPLGSSVSGRLEPGLGLAGGRLAMADVRAVPAGKYGKAALEKLGLWESVRDSIAQAENVRAALKLVAAGEAPLGIVYLTDARAEAAVKIVADFPPESHPPIIYPVGRVTSSTRPEATEFMSFLLSDAAIGLFMAHGFKRLR